MNLICIVKSGSAQGVSFDPIKGNIQIDDNAPLDFGSGSGPASQAANAYLTGLLGTGAPVFQSSAGGVCMSNGSALLTLTGGESPYAPVAASDPVLLGDYLNVYLSSQGQPGYIGAMLGYYNL